MYLRSVSVKFVIVARYLTDKLKTYPLVNFILAALCQNMSDIKSYSYSLPVWVTMGNVIPQRLT